MSILKSLIMMSLSVLTLFAISACSTLSEEECKIADWTDIGRRDGEKGHKYDRFYSHVKACKEYGVTPDSTTYKNGRTQGLKVFCTPENGRRVGESGSGYNRVCPKNMERGFLSQYKIGKKIYVLRRDIRKISNEIETIEKQMDDPKTDRVNQVKLRYRWKELSKNKVTKEKELALAENQTPVTGNSGRSSSPSTPPSASDLAR